MIFEFAEALGSQDPNTASSWANVASGGGQQTELAKGPKAVYRLTIGSESSAPFQVRHWTEATFAAPVSVSPSGQHNIYRFLKDVAGVCPWPTPTDTGGSPTGPLSWRRSSRIRAPHRSSLLGRAAWPAAPWCARPGALWQIGGGPATRRSA